MDLQLDMEKRGKILDKKERLQRRKKLDGLAPDLGESSSENSQQEEEETKA